MKPALTLLIIITSLFTTKPLGANNVLDYSPVSDVAETTSSKASKVRTRQRWTASQFAHLKPAPDKYWDKVAQCETQSNWKDKGKFAGGLGIATTTWQNYGGRQFASSPDRATREEQIIVANRVSMFGFQTKRVFLNLDDIPHKPFFRPPAGFKGWGCIRKKAHLQPPVPGPWEQRRRNP